MSKAWKGGTTSAWRKLRLQILARDGHTCQIRLPDRCKGKADCVHHVVGKANSGDDPQYLQAACTPCNLALGDPTKNTDPEPLVLTKWW